LNVLTNIDNFHRPLERLLKMARKSIILRESLTDGARYRYVVDEYLDDGAALKVYVNSYDTGEVMQFMRSYGFDASKVVDRRTGGGPELVIGYEHYWTFLVGDRGSAALEAGAR
jgi:hypothetical protein